ncbi:hypothetical protein BJX61DRAFT_148533 [Aspergillus egyptiacus]|nr:hypothetical protein BJX61DRAFT_148533 [Aspergillus egyptiacus]
MIYHMGWGTYLLLLACVAACFFPEIYFFYPETARRSFGEITLSLQRTTSKNMTYVHAAKEPRNISNEKVDCVVIQYDFGRADADVTVKMRKSRRLFLRTVPRSNRAWALLERPVPGT